MNVHTFLKHEINSKKTKLMNTTLFKTLKTHLQKNESCFTLIKSYHATLYYPTLFLVVLNSEKETLNLETIAQSIHPKDKKVFEFLLKEILIKNNPASIKNNPLKALFLELRKKHQ